MSQHLWKYEKYQLQLQEIFFPSSQKYSRQLTKSSEANSFLLHLKKEAVFSGEEESSLLFLESKFTLEQVTKAQRGKRGIALLFLSLGR
jgi:hypothetical protein